MTEDKNKKLETSKDTRQHDGKTTGPGKSYSERSKTTPTTTKTTPKKK